MKHLLVIRLSALGDVAILVPVLRAVAAANPDVCFTIAAPPLLAPLFEGIPQVDFLGVKKKQSARAIYRQLRSVGADAVADLHQINRVGRALVLLRLDALLHLRPLPLRRIHKGRLSRLLFLRHLRTSPRRPQWQRYLDVFRRLGLATPRIQNSEFIIQNSKFKNRIGLAPFAQHEGKIWPWEHTSALALMLAEHGREVFLFGSQDEATKLESLAAQHPNITSLAGKHTFAEELEIMRTLGTMVSMDSANMHFASALGVRVVSIWGATHPKAGFTPWQQPADRILQRDDLACRPCSVYGNKACQFGDLRCMNGIAPETIVSRVERIWNEA